MQTGGVNRGGRVSAQGGSLLNACEVILANGMDSLLEGLTKASPEIQTAIEMATDPTKYHKRKREEEAAQAE